ncbi:hypothetical protein GFS60_04678 [Rhodococcus sp. WAY2]|nr:hypothetical protein GFS60_04678 [Rhodococcus sp. WAY2]
MLGEPEPLLGTRKREGTHERHPLISDAPHRAVTPSPNPIYFFRHRLPWHAFPLSEEVRVLLGAQYFAEEPSST